MTKLTVHMPGNDTARYEDCDVDDDDLPLESVSSLVRYFHRPCHPHYDTVLYEDYWADNMVTSNPVNYAFEPGRLVPALQDFEDPPEHLGHG